MWIETHCPNPRIRAIWMSSVPVNNWRVTILCVKVGSLCKNEYHFGSDHGRMDLFPERVFERFVRPAWGRLGFIYGRGCIWGHLCHQPVLRLCLTLMAIWIWVSSDSLACLSWIECLWGQQDLLNILELEPGMLPMHREFCCAQGDLSLWSTVLCGEKRPLGDYFR